MNALHRLLDIELTNRCNALCSFCPRDKTPQQGMMSSDTFYQVIARVEEMHIPPEINFTGQGESLLHPELVNFAKFLKERKLDFGLTTNASLLSTEKAEALLDAGLARITFSVSDFDEDYEEVYALKFDNTRANIMQFLEKNEDRAEVRISIVEHDINREKISDMKKFWRKAGVQHIFHFGQVNRAGACDQGLYFIGSDRFVREAERRIQEHGVSTLCGTPFKWLFVGWNGNYYLCCNDYEKRNPLGTVFDYGIEEMDEIKYRSLALGPRVCRDCDLDPTNKVREKMFEYENGESEEVDIIRILDTIKEQQADYPMLFNDLNWREKYK